jgi:hypothetical protein
MAKDCCQANPGEFINVVTMNGLQKQISGGRTVNVATDLVPGGQKIKVTVSGGGAPEFILDPGPMPIPQAGQAQFLVIPNSSVIVVRHISTQNSPGDTVRIFVADVGVTPIRYFKIDFGGDQVFAAGSPVPIIHYSQDGALLFVHFQIVGTQAANFHAKNLKIICVDDGREIISLGEHFPSNPSNPNVRYFARVTNDGRAQLFIQPSPPQNDVIADAPLPLCPVAINFINFNPAGPDLPSEWLRIKNSSLHDIVMTGWTLSDAAGHGFVFPNFTLAAGAEVLVWTKSGANTATNLYWNSGNPIWNNAASGDIAELHMANGRLVSTYRYSRTSGVVIIPPIIVTPPVSPPVQSLIATDEFFFIVDAKSAIFDTGINVKPGDTIEVRATGEMWERSIFPASFDPSGGPQPTNDSGFPLNGTGSSFPYSLIGKFGAAEPLQFIGGMKRASGFPFGTIFLGVNDNQLGDNRGEFHVSIRPMGLPAPGTSAKPWTVVQTTTHTLTNGSVDFGFPGLLQYGDRFRISAVGMYEPGGVIGGGICDANGLTERAPLNSAFPFRYGEDAKKFALLYRTANCPYYRVAGTLHQNIFRSKTASQLLLRINDDTFGGESGGYIVTVTVERQL